MKGALFVLRGCVGVLVVGMFVLSGVDVLQAMEVKPPLVELRTTAGESAATVFILKNTQAVEQTYAFNIQGFVAQGDKGQQTFLPPENIGGLPSWLYLKMPRVTLAPGAAASIPILFRPPAGTEAGGYQAVVFISRVIPGQVEGVVLGGRVGVLVFATVEGDVRRAVSITSFQRVSPRWSLDFSPRFEVALRNEGQAHEVPGGTVVIKNVLGQTKEKVSLQTAERSGRIIPGSDRRFDVASVKKDGWVDGWGLGLYQAEFLLEEPFMARADGGWFFVIPWKMLGVFALVMVFSIGRSVWRRA